MLSLIYQRLLKKKEKRTIHYQHTDISLLHIFSYIFRMKYNIKSKNLPRSDFVVTSPAMYEDFFLFSLVRGTSFRPAKMRFGYEEDLCSAVLFLSLICSIVLSPTEVDIVFRSKEIVKKKWVIMSLSLFTFRCC